MDDFEKGVMQLLFMSRCIKEIDLEQAIEAIAPDFPNHVQVPLDDLLTKLNKGLKKMSFEIKSVIMKDHSTGERMRYYAIANTEADQVAIDYGGSVLENEVPAFKTVLQHLLLNSYESEHMLEKLRPKPWTAPQMGEYLARMEREGWLKRDANSGYWVVGPRSHIELRALMEQILLDSIDAGEDQDEYAQLRAEALGKLPQLMFH